MSSTHTIKVGDITCVVLLEGANQSAVEGLTNRYPGSTQAEIDAAMGGATEAPMGYNCLYIDNGEVKILADVGFGKNGPPNMGNVLPALNSSGIEAGDIDIVYLTHFHGDHVAGLMDDGKPAYPNARYITTQAEWDEWMPRWETSDQDDRQKMAKAMRSLEDKFTWVHDGDTIATGVRVVDLPGHTLGHSGLLVESNGERMIHLADVLHQDFQFQHTQWQFAFDSDGAMGVATRERILQWCSDEAILTLFYHLEFPGLGHVTREDDTFIWKPI